MPPTPSDVRVDCASPPPPQIHMRLTGPLSLSLTQSLAKPLGHTALSLYPSNMIFHFINASGDWSESEPNNNNNNSNA